MNALAIIEGINKNYPLKRLREQLRWTQERAAVMLNVARSTYIRMERCEYLGVEHYGYIALMEDFYEKELQRA